MLLAPSVRGQLGPALAVSAKILCNPVAAMVAKATAGVELSRLALPLGDSAALEEMWTSFQKDLKDEGSKALLGFVETNLNEAADDAALVGDASQLTAPAKPRPAVPKRAREKLRRSYAAVQKILGSLSSGPGAGSWQQQIADVSRCGVVKAVCRADGSFVWCDPKWKALYERHGELIICKTAEQLEGMLAEPSEDGETMSERSCGTATTTPTPTPSSSSAKGARTLTPSSAKKSAKRVQLPLTVVRAAVRVADGAAGRVADVRLPAANASPAQPARSTAAHAQPAPPPTPPPAPPPPAAQHQNRGATSAPVEPPTPHLPTPTSLPATEGEGGRGHASDLFERGAAAMTATEQTARLDRLISVLEGLLVSKSGSQWPLLQAAGLTPCDPASLTPWRGGATDATADAPFASPRGIVASTATVGENIGTHDSSALEGSGTGEAARMLLSEADYGPASPMTREQRLREASTVPRVRRTPRHHHRAAYADVAIDQGSGRAYQAVRRRAVVPRRANLRIDEGVGSWAILGDQPVPVGTFGRRHDDDIPVGSWRDAWRDAAGYGCGEESDSEASCEDALSDPYAYSVWHDQRKGVAVARSISDIGGERFYGRL